MEVPRDDQGRPIFSISAFRTYGAAELLLDNGEQPRGCPRLYRRKYVDKDLPPQPRSPQLELGSVLHRVLELMENEPIGPEDALMRVWSPQLTEVDWQTAKEILTSYVARQGAMTRYGTLFVELDLTSELYVDEQYGPVMFRTILDYVGLDGDDDGLVHGVDYKSNMVAPKRETVRKDAQLKAQHWQLTQNWDQLIGSGYPRIVMHLDALRYRDVDVRFSPREISDWQDWAVAVARQILRDEDGEPQLNLGCSYCPARHDCPKWLALPNEGQTLSERARGLSTEDMWQRRTDLTTVRKLIDDEITALDGELDEERKKSGGRLKVGGKVWEEVEGWSTEVDWPALQLVLGPRVWELVSTSKTALERVLETLTPAEQDAARACVRRVPTGTRVSKKKAD